MIKCKIGLIAFPINYSKDYFLYLGELYDKKIKNDEKLLYEFYTKLIYLCSFKVLIKDGKIIPDNLTDLFSFQKRYKLTKKIYSNYTISDGIIKYNSPKLYDLDCMVPLYKEALIKNIINMNNSNDMRMFILMSYSDPIIRGEIIDNCINAFQNKYACFLIIEGEKDNNALLTKRYLISRGVKNKDIIINQYNEFPDCIIEAITIINMLYDCADIFLGVSRDEICNVSKNIKLLHNIISIKKRFHFICND